ncbi:hypothetical protein MBLNU230_g6457t1 [Neophaeotheca triangularis]
MWPSRKPTIGLLGPAGAAKSSLINSIIDIPNLALATKRFSVTIEYFDRETIRMDDHGSTATLEGLASRLWRRSHTWDARTTSSRSRSGIVLASEPLP